MLPLATFLLVLEGCRGSVALEPPIIEPADPVLPAPVLRFVGECSRPAVWWLQRDGANLPPTGIWLFSATDSLDFPAVPGTQELVWYELDGSTALALQYGTGALDSLGVARVTAACVTE